MRWAAAALIATAQIGLTCRAAGADPIGVDQVFVPSRLNLHVDLRADIQPAQTFTVGLSGLLTRIDLLLTFAAGASPGRTVGVDVRPTLGSVPAENDGLALFRGSLSLRTVDPFSPDALLSLELGPSSIPVLRGDVLAIVLQPPSSAVWWGRTNATYHRGELYIRAPSFGFPAFTRPSGNSPGELPFDLAFRTFVDPAPIPEPATLLFVGTGLAALAARARRRGVRPRAGSG